MSNPVFDRIMGMISKVNPSKAALPGSELKKLLSGYGIEQGGGCNCAEMIAKMNSWGADECLLRMPEIVAHLVSEADQRGWMRFIPAKAFWAEELVKTAIENARVAACKTSETNL